MPRRSSSRCARPIPIAIRDRRSVGAARARRTATTRARTRRSPIATRRWRDYDEVRRARCPSRAAGASTRAAPGIAFRLIHECFLGLRRRKSGAGLDPVIPKSLDGLRADVELAGKRASVVYNSADLGYGPTAVTLNGKALRFDREANPYRAGGVEVSMAALHELLTDSANTLEIQLG